MTNTRSVQTHCNIFITNFVNWLGGRKEATQKTTTSIHRLVEHNHSVREHTAVLCTYERANNTSVALVGLLI